MGMPRYFIVIKELTTKMMVVNAVLNTEEISARATIDRNLEIRCRITNPMRTKCSGMF